jgi:hypothetical protein
VTTRPTSQQLRWRIAVCESSLDATARLVALVLDTFMNGTGFAWPSRVSVADRAGLDVRTVDKAIARLERAGLLVVHRSRGRNANRYHAALPNSVPSAAVAGAPTVFLAPPQQRLSRHPTVSSAPHEAVKKTPEKPLRGRACRAPTSEGEQSLDGEHEVDAKQLVAHYVATYKAATGLTAPKRVRGQIAGRVVELLAEGQPLAVIRRALELLVERPRLHPSTLATLMGEAAAPADGRGRSNTQKIGAVVARLDAAEEENR